MPKTKTMIIIIILIIIAGSFVFFFWLSRQVSKSPSIIHENENISARKSPAGDLEATGIEEIRDFACKGMSGFSFQYPVFKGWEFKESGINPNNPNECDIYLNSPDGIYFEQSTQIRVKKIDGALDEAPANTSINSNNIAYWPLSGLDGYVFMTDKFKVTISLVSVSEEYGFSREKFFEVVINSFKVGQMITLEKNESKKINELTITNLGGGHLMLDTGDEPFTVLLISDGVKEEKITLHENKDIIWGKYVFHPTDMGWNGSTVTFILKGNNP